MTELSIDNLRTEQSPRPEPPQGSRNKRANRESSMRPRPVDYDWSQLPVHWYKSDPQLTHTINVLNLLLPEGETWFVRVFAACIPYLSEDPGLRRDIRGFMGQESHHANAHQELLDYLDAHDIPTKAYTDFIAWLLNDQLGDNPFGYKLKSSWAQRKWDTLRLAGVAALEHVTGFLGGWALVAERLEDPDVDENMVDLLRWHGAEEVEHQSVALDMLANVSPNHHHHWRTAMFIVAFPILFAAWVQGVRYLMAKDRRVSEGPTWRGWFEAGRRGQLPTITSLLKTVPRLMDPDYDPSVEEPELMRIAVAQIAKSHGADMV